MPAPIDPRVHDQESRNILRLNALDAKRDRFDAEWNRQFQATNAITTDLSREAVREALNTICYLGEYKLPVEMPKCERNSLYGNLDRLARMWVRV